MDPSPLPAPAKKRRAHPTLAILSRKKSLYSTRRLVEAAKAHGLRPKVLDVLACDLLLESGKPRLFHKGKELRRPDVGLPRIGASVTNHGLAVVRQLEALGVPLCNGARAIEASRDKLRSLQLLSSQGVPVPRTVLARGGGELSALVQLVGGLPAILKLLQGTQGVGVMIAHSMAEVESILTTLRDLGQEILLQEFIVEARGADVRALVVGGRVIGAMRREARSGEFRSNLHRGGAGKSHPLDPEFEAVAVRAAQVLRLEVAGVDLLESKDGAKVMEVNSSPGFEGLEKASGVDVAGAIVQRARELVK